MIVTYKEIIQDICNGLHITLSDEEIDKARDILIHDLQDKCIEQFLFIEDGSVKKKDIKEIQRRNPEIKVVVYRQGAPIPIVKDC